MFTRDEDLPTWLHTTLLILVVSPFAGFLLFHGVVAIFSAQLPVIMGPDFGTFLVKAPLAGKPAVLAGIGLLFMGAAFLGIAYLFSRFSDDGIQAKALPWALLAIGLLLTHSAQR